MDEIGTLTTERITNWDASFGAWRIARADPCIRISRQFIASIRADELAAYADLDGDVLTIRDDYGQRYIYRIRWDDYADGGYLAEWD